MGVYLYSIYVYLYFKSANTDNRGLNWYPSEALSSGIQISLLAVSDFTSSVVAISSTVCVNGCGR